MVAAGRPRVHRGVDGAAHAMQECRSGEMLAVEVGHRASIAIDSVFPGYHLFPGGAEQRDYPRMS
jgi:hypothetical protein